MVLFFLSWMLGGTLYAQNVTVSGVVTDEQTKEGVIGASVLVKGTTTGTIADFEGNFSFKAPLGAEIVVSAVGYADYTF